MFGPSVGWDRIRRQTLIHPVESFLAFNLCIGKDEMRVGDDMNQGGKEQEGM
jgi:hypothetical protein